MPVKTSKPVKTLIAAVVLGLVPAISFASPCSSRAVMDQQAMTCVPGTAFDAATGNCEPVGTS